MLNRLKVKIMIVHYSTSGFHGLDLTVFIQQQRLGADAISQSLVSTCQAVDFL